MTALNFKRFFSPFEIVYIRVWYWVYQSQLCWFLWFLPSNKIKQIQYNQKNLRKPVYPELFYQYNQPVTLHRYKVVLSCLYFFFLCLLILEEFPTMYFEDIHISPSKPPRSISFLTHPTLGPLFVFLSPSSTSVLHMYSWMCGLLLECRPLTARGHTRKTRSSFHRIYHCL